MKNENKTFALRPLVKSDIPIPETFENTIITTLDDLEIQKQPSQWFSRNRHAVIIKKNSIYNKPVNVSFKAYLQGFKPVNKANIASIEITVRQGQFEFFNIRFI